MSISAEDLVRREVLVCVSSLVSTLAAGCYATGWAGSAKEGAHALRSLCEQAQELAAPIPDYEEAAREAGWEPGDGGRWSNDDDWVDSAQEACERDNIEPRDREVYEHWAVTDWLADQLEARGEKVDRDFAGLTVWARTTTGQMIAMDGVIEAIAADIAASWKSQEELDALVRAESSQREG